MNFRPLPIPATLPRWQSIDDVLDTRDRLCDEATLGPDEVLRWNESGNVVPLDVMEECYTLPVNADAHKAARDAELAEVVARYRDWRANMTDEERAEEAFEMLAAFGPGETVVDIVTGETFET